MNENRVRQTVAGVFLIGLTLLAMFGYWFPGILFVIGLSLVVERYLHHGDRHFSQSGWALVGAGVIFTVYDVLVRTGRSGWYPWIVTGLAILLLVGADLRRFVGTEE